MIERSVNKASLKRKDLYQLIWIPMNNLTISDYRINECLSECKDFTWGLKSPISLVTCLVYISVLKEENYINK